MIGRLKGKLLEKHPPQLLIDVQGVGYEVDAPMSTFYRLPEIGQEVLLFTHLVVREDAQQLFGFADQNERHVFRTLIRVNGVGPKMALAILSGMEFDTFVRSVMDHDIPALTRIPGVGKKTAERLVIEMRDRLKEFADFPGNGLDGEYVAEASSARQDAISALEALGYKPADAAKAIARIQLEGLSSEEIIRQALQTMGRS